MRNLFVLFFVLISFAGWSQCDVVIVPGSIEVIDNEPGVRFQFDIQNNSGDPYNGGTLYMAWTLDNDDPIWEFTLTNPLPSGQTMEIITPVFDMPAVWDVDDYDLGINEPTLANPWLEAQDWFFYGVPTPFDGSWSNIRLYLNDCFVNPNVVEIVLPDGEYYYGPIIDGCINDIPDQFCDLNCDIGINYLDALGFEIGVFGDDCYDIGIYPPEDGIDEFITVLSFGGPPPCGNINYQGFPVLYEGDNQYFDFYTYGNGNLACADTIPLAFEQSCKIQLGVSQPNQLLSIDINGSNNNIIVEGDLDCEFVVTAPDIGLDSLTYQLGGCFGEPLYWIPEVNITNYGDEVVTELCIEFDIWNVAGVEPDTICFDNLNILPGQSYVLELPQNFNGGDDQLLISTELLNSNGTPEAFGPNNTMSNQFIMWCYDCIDPEADNYNPYATNPDDPDNCEYLGCTDEEATNYDPTANVDDDSCEYLGCTDPAADNFDPNANVDDESCIYLGCTDSNADNYDPFATEDDGSCTFLGCTDENAINYDPGANVDDGSCEYNIYGCTDSEALNYDGEATIDDGTCIYSPPFDFCDDVEVFAPNTFTPNNDGLNDAWYVVTDAECWKEWHVSVYNRWGSLVWESFKPEDKWTGNDNNGNYFVADGVYVYTIIANKWNTDAISLSGHLTLLR